MIIGEVRKTEEAIVEVYPDHESPETILIHTNTGRTLTLASKQLYTLTPGKAIECGGLLLVFLNSDIDKFRAKGLI